MCIHQASLPSACEAGVATRASMVYVSRDGSCLRTRSFWPEISDIPMEDASLEQSWRHLLTKAPDGRIDLHPEFVVPVGESADAPLLYTWRAEPDSNPESPFASLAILRPQTQRVAPLPGLPWRVPLRKHYLLADLIAGNKSVEALKPLVEGMAQLLRSGESDWIVLEEVEVGSVFESLLNELNSDPNVAVCSMSRSSPHRRLRFPSKSEEVWKIFSSRERRRFRKRLERFPHQLRCYRDPSEVGLFLEKAQEVSKKTWQTRYFGLRITGDDQQRQWLERLAALGALRAYILEHDGAPVSFILSHQWNGIFQGEETGYDPAYAECTPGIVLFVRMLQDLIAQDTPRLLDFKYGDYSYKQLFSNEHTQTRRVILVRRAMKPLLVARIRQVRSAIVHVASALLHKNETLLYLARKWRHRPMR